MVSVRSSAIWSGTESVPKIGPLAYEASFTCVSSSPFRARRTQVGSGFAPQENPLVALVAQLVASVLCPPWSQAAWVAPVLHHPSSAAHFHFTPRNTKPEMQALNMYEPLFLYKQELKHSRRG